MDNSLENLSNILEALIKGAKGTKEPPAPISRGESGVTDTIKKHVRTVIDDPNIKEKLQNIVSDKKFKQELTDSNKTHSEALKSLSNIFENKNEVEKKLQERFDNVNQKIEKLFKLQQEKEKQTSDGDIITQKTLEVISKKQESPKSILEEREKVQSVNVVDFSELALEKLSKMFALNVKQMSKDGKQTKTDKEEESGGGGLLDLLGNFFIRKGKNGGRNRGNKPKGDNKTRNKPRNKPSSSKNPTQKTTPETKPSKPTSEKPPKPAKPTTKATNVKPPKGTTKALGKTLAKAGRIAGPVAAVGLAGLEYADRKSEGQTTTQALGGAAGSAVGGIGGGWAGAATGAALGSVVGPVGTVVGGIVGGILGSMGGSWLGGKAADKLTGADEPSVLETPNTPVTENKASVPSSPPVEIKKEDKQFDDRYPTGVPPTIIVPSLSEKQQIKEIQPTQNLKIANLYVQSAVIDRIREETKEATKKSDVYIPPKTDTENKTSEEKVSIPSSNTEKSSSKTVDQKFQTTEKLSSKPNLISSETSPRTEKFESIERPDELSSDVIKELKKKTWEGKEKPEPVVPPRLISPDTQKDTETIKIENDKKVGFELQKLNDKTDDSNRLLMAIVQSVNTLNQIMSDPDTNTARGNNIIFNNSQNEKDPELTAIEIAKAGDPSISNWRNEASYFRSNPV